MIKYIRCVSLLLLCGTLASCERQPIEFDRDLLRFGAESHRLHGKSVSLSGYIRTDLEEFVPGDVDGMIYDTEEKALAATEININHGVRYSLHEASVLSRCNGLLVDVIGTSGASDQKRASIYPTSITLRSSNVAQTGSEEGADQPVNCLEPLPGF